MWQLGASWISTAKYWSCRAARFQLRTCYLLNMWQVGGRVSSTAGASLTYCTCEAKQSNNDQLLTKKRLVFFVWWSRTTPAHGNVRIWPNMAEVHRVNFLCLHDCTWTGSDFHSEPAWKPESICRSSDRRLPDFRVEIFEDGVVQQHSYNICTTSALRLRRWSNIIQMLYKCFAVLAMVLCSIWNLLSLRKKSRV